MGLGKVDNLVRHHFRGLVVGNAHEVLLVKGAFTVGDISQITVPGLVPLGPYIFSHVGVPLHAINVHRLSGC